MERGRDVDQQREVVMPFKDVPLGSVFAHSWGFKYIKINPMTCTKVHFDYINSRLIGQSVNAYSIHEKGFVFFKDDTPVVLYKEYNHSYIIEDVGIARIFEE